MKIKFKNTFLTRVTSQIKYISKDSPTRARKFKNQLLEAIKEIPNRPLSYRKSIYFEDDSIRDMIFKGYTIVFRITKDSIEIFGFVKYQKGPTENS